MHALCSMIYAVAYALCCDGGRQDGQHGELQGTGLLQAARGERARREAVRGPRVPGRRLVALLHAAAARRRRLEASRGTYAYYTLQQGCPDYFAQRTKLKIAQYKMYTKILAQGTKLVPEPQVWTTLHYSIVYMPLLEARALLEARTRLPNILAV